MLPMMESFVMQLFNLVFSESQLNQGRFRRTGFPSLLPRLKTKSYTLPGYSFIHLWRRRK
jgi:hypothetical protein